MSKLRVALLRGINVGGHHKLRMAELRELLSQLGYADVRTYLQSGNAVFRTSRGPDHDLEATLENALGQRFGFPVPTLVRDGAYLRAVRDANPFLGKTQDPKQLHVVFLGEHPSQQQVADLGPTTVGVEQFQMGDRAIYLFCPNGIGRTKLPPFDRRLKIRTTARNWKTVNALCALVEA